MNNIFQDNELNDIFNWLNDYMTEPEQEQVIPERLTAKPEHHTLAWQAARAHHQFLLDNGLFREPIKLLAASDGKLNERGFCYSNLLGGDCSLFVEYIQDDPDWKIVKVKFSEHRIKEFQKRHIKIVIAGKEFDLGAVDQNGIAEAEIPGHLDVAQIELVEYGKYIKPK